MNISFRNVILKEGETITLGADERVWSVEYEHETLWFRVIVVHETAAAEGPGGMAGTVEQNSPPTIPPGQCVLCGAGSPLAMLCTACFGDYQQWAAARGRR